jgi:hypothetical protein
MRSSSSLIVGPLFIAPAPVLDVSAGILAHRGGFVTSSPAGRGVPSGGSKPSGDVRERP